MTSYVIGPDVAIRLAHDQAVIGAEHQIVAPTLFRSQTLSLLYQEVRRGEMTKKDADDGSITYAGCVFGYSETVSFRPLLGRLPTNSGGPIPL